MVSFQVIGKEQNAADRQRFYRTDSVSILHLATLPSLHHEILADSERLQKANSPGEQRHVKRVPFPPGATADLDL
jgi:hypothetical protein